MPVCTRNFGAAVLLEEKKPKLQADRSRNRIRNVRRASARIGKGRLKTLGYGTYAYTARHGVPRLPMRRSSRLKPYVNLNLRMQLRSLTPGGAVVSVRGPLSKGTTPHTREPG